MIRPVLRLLALTFVLGAALTAAAAAQNAAPPVPAAPSMPAPPALRANVTVTGDIVRIGDLVENAGPVADVPIFRAPDLGTRGAVSIERVLEAIRPHQLIGIDTRGLSEVIVTRASRTITPKEISAAVAEALAGQYGFGSARNIAVSFDQAVHTLHVEADATGDLQVLALAFDPRSARFDVTFDLPSSAILHQLAPRFTGSAIATVDALTVDHPFERGEVLKASDLVVALRPRAEGPFIGDVKAAAGMAVRHELRPGQALRGADLMKPAIVQSHDIVAIVYQAPGLTLTLRGQAQQSGALGDEINVVNMETKRVVQGIVIGSGEVRVGAVTTQVAEASASPVVVSSPPPLQ